MFSYTVDPFLTVMVCCTVQLYNKQLDAMGPMFRFSNLLPQTVENTKHAIYINLTVLVDLTDLTDLTDLSVTTYLSIIPTDTVYNINIME